MKHPPVGFSQHYRQALCDQLAHSSVPDQKVVGKISAEIRSAGFPVLELAKLHERFLIEDLLPGCNVRKQTAIIRKAGNFFAAVLAADGVGHAGTKDSARLKKTIESLSSRTVELATANRQLSQEISQRKKVEAALRKSEQHGLKALQKSETLKEELRGLSRQILTIQEEERKKISRELHDVVAQALVGIDVRLAALKTGAGMDARELSRKISLTQKMVKKSANMVHQYARELRPAALDDLGLLPALHSFMKSFTARTGIRTHLTAFEEVEKLNSAKRTTLYRVAQEALTNVARHACASRVEVTIHKEAKFVRMDVRDDGKSFLISPVLFSRGTKHLGLLGMRERVEMVGGRFKIESSPENGTTIIARIPIGRSNHHKPPNNHMNDPTR